MARRFRRWPSVWTVLAAIVLLAAATRLWWPRQGWPGQAARRDSAIDSSLAGSESALESGPCEILRTLDGNTLLVAQNDGKQYCVRLLGLIASEDPRALAMLTEIARPGAAQVELDKRRVAADGAWLAYIFVEERLVSTAILRAGWGRYEPYPGDSFSHSRQMKEAEAAARREKLGIWARP
jgi:endonuclease YncB( thermonuclease family)